MAWVRQGEMRRWKNGSGLASETKKQKCLTAYTLTSPRGGRTLPSESKSVFPSTKNHDCPAGGGNAVGKKLHPPRNVDLRRVAEFRNRDRFRNTLVAVSPILTGAPQAIGLTKTLSYLASARMWGQSKPSCRVRQRTKAGSVGEGVT